MTIVTDPFTPEIVGIKFPKVEANIVTISHQHKDHNNSQAVLGNPGNPYVVKGPGEYEVSGVFIRGISSFHDNKEGAERGKNTIYRIDLEGLSLVHLGDLGQKLTDEQLDFLSGVDILFIPVGGTYTIDAEQASELIPKIEPSIVIPMHYNETKLNQENFGKLGKLESFFSEMGKELNIQPKISVKKDKLPEELQVVALE